MIFTLELRFRNCPSCKRKVNFRWDRCAKCRAPFSDESNQMIKKIEEELLQRTQVIMDTGEIPDPERIRYSKFYLYTEKYGYHHIFGMPLYSLEELLIVQNIMYKGHPYPQESTPQPTEWIASFRYTDCLDPLSMRLLSWLPLHWDEEQQLFLVGLDQGPRTVKYTNYE